MAGTQAGSTSSSNSMGKAKMQGESTHGKTIEERLEEMNLIGEEEEDLDLSGEFEELLKDVRWLAIFRVHTKKIFSQASLFNHMRNAWSTAKEINFKVKGTNLFLAQFHCLGDWNKVMEGGPWIFRGAPVVLEEYDGFSNVHSYKLDKIPVWTRIQGIPEGLMKKKELAEKVAQKVGKPPIKVIVDDGKLNPSSYLRARVFLELDKPLVRVIHITLRERNKYKVQYEKLPVFCNHCGLLGHDVSECGDGVHDPDKCEWGDFLLVDFGSPMNPRGGYRGGSARGGFSTWGRGRGRGGLNEEEDEMDFAMNKQQG